MLVARFSRSILVLSGQLSPAARPVNVWDIYSFTVLDLSVYFDDRKLHSNYCRVRDSEFNEADWLSKRLKRDRKL